MPETFSGQPACFRLHFVFLVIGGGMAMWRLDTLLGAGVGLVIGIALAWVGTSLFQDRGSADADLMTQKQAPDALMREIAELRQELTLHKQNLGQPRGPVPAETRTKTAAAAAVEQTTPRGQITKIDPVDATVVEVNVGKDAGLAKYNNLEILRGKSPSEHIGTLRVFEVYAERAVCRLVSTNPLKRQVPRVGDEVSAAR
jgi:hypothetical protein